MSPSRRNVGGAAEDSTPMHDLDRVREKIEVRLESRQVVWLAAATMECPSGAEESRGAVRRRGAGGGAVARGRRPPARGARARSRWRAARWCAARPLGFLFAGRDARRSRRLDPRRDR